MQTTAAATGNRTWAQTDAASLSIVWDIKPAPPGAGQPYYLRDQANAAQFKFGFGQQG